MRADARAATLAPVSAVSLTLLALSLLLVAAMLSALLAGLPAPTRD